MLVAVFPHSLPDDATRRRHKPLTGSQEGIGGALLQVLAAQVSTRVVLQPTRPCQ